MMTFFARHVFADGSKREQADEQLLRSKVDPKWTDGDPWRVLRIMGEFVEGFESLADIGKAVTVFGSARVPAGHPYYQLAQDVGKVFAEAGYAVISGGGPGIMEATCKGAYENEGTTIGLGIELPHEQGINEFVEAPINFHYFFVRKTMFVKYAQAFLALPGGFGTLDELFECVTLVQTEKIRKFPIVLVGRDYWQDLMEWMRKRLVAEGMCRPEELDIIQLVDSANEALQAVQENSLQFP